VTTQPDTDAPRWINGDLTRFCGKDMHDRCKGTISTAGIESPCLCKCHSDVPQEGRPTTPQTEAGRALLSGPAMRRALLSDVLAIEREAAAGALPSVERLAQALHGVMCSEGLLSRSDHEHAERILTRLAAAPPEASER
jgi:hypothetical protein